MKLTGILSLFLVKVCVGDPLSLNVVPCDAALPDYDECLRQSIQRLFSNLVKPEPEGPPPSLREPFRAHTLTLGPGDKLFAARLVLSDIETYGWAQTKFQLGTVNTKRLNITVRGRTPTFRIKSQYRADGKFLDRPLVGQGILITTFDNVLWQWDGNFEVVARDGNKYWRRYASTINLEPEGLRLELENQDAGLVQKINEGWKSWFLELRRDYENVLNAAFTRWVDPIYYEAPIKTFVINFLK